MAKKLSKAAKKRDLPNKKKVRKHTAASTWWKDTKVWTLLSALLVLTAIVFSPALNGEFVNWDDDIYVTDNNYLVNFDVEAITTFFTQPIASNYHPLTILSLAIDYQLVGKSPFWYHMHNLLWHFVNIILVFYFVFLLSKRYLSRLPSFNIKLQSAYDASVMVAIMAAAIFAIHPMHVESVAWISERKDVLYACFLLLSLISYLHYLDHKKWQYFLTTSLFFILSCLCKPAAVILPLLLFLLDYLFQRPINAKSILEKVPLLGISVLFGVLTIIIQADSAIGDPDKYSFLQRSVFAAYGFSAYVIKFFVPFQLSTLHPYPLLVGNFSTAMQVAPIVALGIIGASLYSIKHTKVIIFSVAFYLITVILVLQFLSVGMAVMSERYTYVPYIGLSLIVGAAYVYLIQKKPQWRNMFLVAFCGWLLALSAVSFVRCGVWQNSERLWSDVIEKYPDAAPVAHNNRGTFYRDKGKSAKAIQDFNAAIKLKNDYHLAYNNRGNVYFSRQQNDKALADYNKVLSIKPDDSKAYCNRAAVYFQQGKYTEGIADATKALALQPIYPDAMINRAVLYSVTNNHAAAKKDYDNYLRYRPNNHQAYNWRGLALRHLKQYPQALNDFNKAIQLHAKVGEYYLNRSYIHADMGNTSAALKDAQKAQQLGQKVDAAYMNGLR